MSSAPPRAEGAKNGLVMHAHELDAIDIRILTALQQGGRMSNIQLSRAVQMSAPPTLRRTRTLEEKGYIRGYQAQLDLRKLGFEVMAFVFVGLASQSDRDIKAFEQSVQLWVPVRACYALSGESDFLLKCVAKDLTSLQKFVSNVVMKTTSVQFVKTVFARHVTKEEPDAPLSQVQAATPLGAARKLRLPPIPR